MIAIVRSISFICLIAAGGCKSLHTLAPVVPPATQPIAPPTPYHLHLCGIGGYRWLDKNMLRGLQDGGLDGEVQAYDWTGSDVGLGALLVKARHEEQSHKVAQMILDASNAEPGRRITITCHSAGAGIVAWALEQLPPGVNVETVVMLAPALSPTYDLTPALRHINGKLYVFYSAYDVAVLGLGTKMMGTVDGVKTDAAGRVSFTMPRTADPVQYEKLVQFPYSSSWMKLGNIGDHIGPLSRSFAREILAPLMLNGKMPAGVPPTTTRSATSATQPAAAQ